MDNRIAKFEKVSFEQFKKDWLKILPTSKTSWSDEELKALYDGIELPKRSTKGSAGYDVKAPSNFTVHFGCAKVIPTGIRCKMEENWYLDINPRSGQGFKFGISLANTRGIIDSDYYNADNEGHIMIKVVNNNSAVNEDKKPFDVDKGQAFAQGIFNIYGITIDDESNGTRVGGFGSTDKK